MPEPDDALHVVRIAADDNGTKHAVIFCPGCCCGHAFTFEGRNRMGAQWQWNGDRIKPTFSPSMHVKSAVDGRSICHSYVRGGNIEFLQDCRHQFAGQSVPLEPF